MQELKRFQIRGVPGLVTRAAIENRIVDFWIPKGGSDELLLAHDGQNIFDGRTSTFRGQTWKMAQSAIRVSRKLGKKPPAIIATWHSSTKSDPWGRAKDLTPQDIFETGQYLNPKFRPDNVEITLHGNGYLNLIFGTIVPLISPGIAPENTAMIGSSMGGLCTLYALKNHHQSFSTALALSPHWVLSDESFVQKMIQLIPEVGTHRIWMSRGTKGLDRSYETLQNLADELMYAKGYSHSQFSTKVYPRSSHNERSWSRYLDEPMEFWLGR